jgi:hypothetical protein
VVADGEKRPVIESWARNVAVAVGFLLLTWFFMGGYGLVVGGLVIGSWWLIGLSRTALWAAAVVLLAAGMLILLAGNLPSSRVVGAQFGVDHLLAHRVVGASLAMAVFAALNELTGLRRGWRDTSLARAARRIWNAPPAGERPSDGDPTPT